MINKLFKLASVVSIGILAAGASGAAARTASSGSPKKAENANVHVDEVAHLPLDGMHVNQMFVERLDNNRVYLYLQRSAKGTFAVVDVSNPAKPVLLSPDALQETAGSEVQPPAEGSALAVVFIPEGSLAHPSLAAEPLPTETVQFLDMSDPENVKSVQTIKGVTSVYADDARNLVYLVNDGGLWILSHYMPPAEHLCGSGDALNPLPNCQ
jgi:hypothetical protein